MLLLILCLVPRVLSDMSQHHVYVSRKSRDNSEPYTSGYVYKKENNKPGTFATFGSGMMKRDSDSSRLTMIDSEPVGAGVSKINFTPMASFMKSVPKYDIEFLPSKIKTDSMYEQMKSAMHFLPPVTPPPPIQYDTHTHHVHVTEDPGTTSIGLSAPTAPISPPWTYSYNPYEIEHMRIDAEIEKAKDKRYTAEAAKIIPIHEDLSDDIPNSREPLVTSPYYPVTNYPIGHFQHSGIGLSDYFNKRNDFKDQFTFSDLGKGKYFDSESFRGLNDNYSKYRRGI